MGLFNQGWGCYCDQCNSRAYTIERYSHTKTKMEAIALGDGFIKRGSKFFCNEVCEADYRRREASQKMLDKFREYTIQKCKQETAKTLQLAIRIEAADESGMCQCVTCPTRKHYKEMHAGHFVAGRSNGVLFVEKNIHTQCIRCNNYLSGNQEAYAQFMVETYGEQIVEKIQQRRHEDIVFTKEQLVDMRLDYMERVKVQKERLGE